MKTQIHPKPTLTLSLMTIGIILGIVLSVTAAWPDLEASFYGFSNRASRPLPGLSCPILMTKDEVGTVKLKVTNQTDRDISPSVRMEFSSRLAAVTAAEYIELAQGESRTLTWTVDSENVDLGRFIFAKALVYAVYPTPDRENTCGVLVLPIPGKGAWIITTLTVICLLSLGSGYFLVYRIKPHIKQMSQLLFIAVITLLLLITSFLGWWLQAVFLFALFILVIVIALGTFITR